jgi:hypothetical protein
MAGNTTQVVRNWKATIGFIVGGLVAGALSVVLFMTIVEGAISFGFALLPGILALILIGAGWSAAGEAPCPGCNAPLSALSTGDNDGVVCEKCFGFFEGKAGKLHATDPARVAERPLFGAKLPERYEWPDGCCVCGATATRKEAVTTTVQNTGSAAAVIGVSAVTGGAVTGSAGTTKFTIEVPHCDAHNGGADLSAMGGKDLKLRFKSYPYLRAFCERNGLKPS